MNIAVLIKMVPDTESKLEVNDGTLSDQNFKYMVNPVSYTHLTLPTTLQV